MPAPRQVFAIALNYAPHAAEAGFEPPEEPLVFTKFPSCITGPVTTIALPEGHVDWEIEVVAVIGRGGYRIPRAEAWDAVAGLTLGQDLSERLLQLTGKPPQFSLAKSHPGFGPIGPVPCHAGQLADRDDVGFESSIDGEVIQRGRTSQMIFPVDDLVARLSAVCPLLPGDLIFTGTPEGVGNRRTPQRVPAARRDAGQPPGRHRRDRPDLRLQLTVQRPGKADMGQASLTPPTSRGHTPGTVPKPTFTM